MRLIDADALLEALKDNGTIRLREDGCRYDDFIYHSDAVALITNAPTIHSDGWLSVENSPPERIEGMKILCFGNGYIFEAEYEDGFWVNLGGDDFTHWQPLPPAPTDKGLTMNDLEFINKEEEFKTALREYIEACESWGTDVRSRLLDCIHNELVANNHVGIPED